eukprot:jgi/Galph1/5158/GphlegSOOS_G3863.1
MLDQIKCVSFVGNCTHTHLFLYNRQRKANVLVSHKAGQHFGLYQCGNDVGQFSRGRNTVEHSCKVLKTSKFLRNVDYHVDNFFVGRHASHQLCLEKGEIRPSTRVDGQRMLDTNQSVSVYKQLLKKKLENNIPKLFDFPSCWKACWELSRLTGPHLTVSHSLLENLGLNSPIRLPRYLFFIFLSIFFLQKKWIGMGRLTVENIEYLSPEEFQLVAKFHFRMFVNGKQTMWTNFLRLDFDRNGLVTDWREFSSDPISKLASTLSEQSTTSSTNMNDLKMENHTSHSSFVDDLDAMQKKLVDALLRKKFHIHRSEWYHSKVQKIMEWSREQIPKVFSQDVVPLDVYSEWIELENPFVVAYGISAVQQVHRGIRMHTKILFQHVQCDVLSISHPNPESVVAIYRIHGKGRFFGGKVQYLSRNILTIDLDGKIIRHQEIWDIEREQVVKMWLSNHG